ncbi:MAG: ScpA family protein [Micrococcales bacterium]|nr:ScpA family protein [Micrococcales bacterium]
MSAPPVVEAATSPQTPGGVLTRRPPASAFEVHLDVFSGPFDLLLGLIAKHKLDITEIALAQVTDEFIGHIRAQQADDDRWDLSQASEFLLVAATLLDLKAARLLPRTGEEDAEDLALIEVRDLLFARLMQYRAFKEVAAWVEGRIGSHGAAVPRQAGLEPRFAALLPELVLAVTPEQLARIAADALTPKPPPTVGLTHLHAPVVSVREQADELVARLRTTRVLSFRDLVADADSIPVVVARFLALLDLFREAAVAFDQAEALGELTVQWIGRGEGAIEAGAEFDEDPAQPQAADATHYSAESSPP